MAFAETFLLQQKIVRLTEETGFKAQESARNDTVSMPFIIDF